MTRPKKRRPKSVVPRLPRTIAGEPISDLDRKILAPSPQIVVWLHDCVRAFRGQISEDERRALSSDIANFLAARLITDDIIAAEAAARQLRARARAARKKRAASPRTRPRKTR